MRRWVVVVVTFLLNFLGREGGRGVCVWTFGQFWGAGKGSWGNARELEEEIGCASSMICFA